MVGQNNKGGLVVKQVVRTGCNLRFEMPVKEPGPLCKSKQTAQTPRSGLADYIPPALARKKKGGMMREINHLRFRVGQTTRQEYRAPSPGRGAGKWRQKAEKGDKYIP
jgi:hypothetical protein